MNLHQIYWAWLWDKCFKHTRTIILRLGHDGPLRPLGVKFWFSNNELWISRATSHMELRAHDHYTSSTLIGGNGGACPSSLDRTLEDQRSMWMQDGCKVYMDFTWHRMGSCSMVTWTIFKHRLLEVGLTQNRENVAFRTLTTVDLLYFNMCEDLYEWKSIEIAYDRGPNHIWLHTTLEDPWPHYMTLEVYLGRRLNTFFWALTISWPWLVCEVALSSRFNKRPGALTNT